MSTADDDQPPPELAALDAELRGLRFEPRASFGPELLGRLRAGEADVRPIASRWRFASWPLAAAAAAVVAFVTGAAITGAWRPMLDAARGVATIDNCCFNYDAETEDDDGLYVESLRGDRIRRLVIYEDRDGDRRFSAADGIRFERTGALTLAVPDDDALVARRFCCLDYDGGGPKDDGLLVVNRPGGGVVLAALFEMAGGTTAEMEAQPRLR